jgi:hypothetical protein
MGHDTGSVQTYQATVKRLTSKGRATRQAEETFARTGEQNPLVDPGTNEIRGSKVRESLTRFNDLDAGPYADKFEVSVGLSVPVAIDLDTTGSMRDNVEIALRRIPDVWDYLGDVMRPGCEAHIATGVFNDVRDSRNGAIISRSQYEMTEKMVEQMQYHIPLGGGAGNQKEDSQFSLFAAAYLSALYINRIGLKSYYFNMTDDAAASHIDPSELKRIFRDDVAEAVANNGHEIDINNLSTDRVVQDLLTRTHVFSMLVDGYDHERVNRYWTGLLGAERVIVIPSTQLAPEVISVVVGLTEGTLDLLSVKEFLTKRGVNKSDADTIERSVRNIPIGAQTLFENFNNIPVKGDIFATKEDLWPEVKAADRVDLAPDTATAPAEAGTWI